MLGKCSVDGCDETHSSMMHGSHIADISAHLCSSLRNVTMQSPDENSTNVDTQPSSGTVEFNQNVLLLIEQIKVKKTTVITF